jgi:predicted PurR-regulated permease PerM
MLRTASSLYRATALLIFILALGALLLIGRNFLYPLCLAVLFAYLLYPPANWLESKGIPRIISNLICIIIALLIIAGIALLVTRKMMLFMDEVPKMQLRAEHSLDMIGQQIVDRLNLQRSPHFLKEKVLRLLSSGGGAVAAAVTATTGTIVKLLLIPVYVFFLLYYRNKYYVFICKMLPPHKHHKAENIVEEISTTMRRYMAGVVTVVLILCVLNSVGLMIVGIHYALLFGVISALLNFVPYFGTLIGGVIPLSYTLLMSPDPGKAIGVVILYLIIQFLDHNILTPNITGSYVRVSPFMIILGIILGGMLWGLPGMIISVPTLATVKIISSHIQHLKAIAFLISDKGTIRHALTWAKVKGFFRRK